MVERDDKNHDPYEAAGLVEEALRLSAHVLAHDPSQLPSQLTGRLLSEDSVQVRGLLAKALHSAGAAWRRPLWADLTPPGGPLVRTLSGHTDGVNAVAVTPDGKQAVSASLDQTLKVWDLERGTVVATFTCDGPASARCCAFGGDRRIVAGDQSGRVHFLTLEL